MRVLVATVLLCGATTLVYAQQSRPSTPVKGLSVTSALLERKPYAPGRLLTVGLQNNSDKTIVAYSLLVTELDGQGNKLSQSGMGWDYLPPDGTDTSHFINPGQPATVEGFSTFDDRIASVKVTVDAVVYLDRTYEGTAGPVGAIFDHRLHDLQRTRKRLAEEKLSPAERAALEKHAAFIQDAATPQEVQ